MAALERLDGAITHIQSQDQRLGHLGKLDRLKSDEVLSVRAKTDTLEAAVKKANREQARSALDLEEKRVALEKVHILIHMHVYMHSLLYSLCDMHILTLSSRLVFILCPQTTTTITTTTTTRQVQSEKDVLKARCKEMLAAGGGVAHGVGGAKRARGEDGVAHSHSQGDGADGGEGGGADTAMLDLLTKMLRCSVCNVNFKEVAITRCMHLFCRSCTDKVLPINNAIL